MKNWQSNYLKIRPPWNKNAHFPFYQSWPGAGRLEWTADISDAVAALQ
jgi:hypothetical protein